MEEFFESIPLLIAIGQKQDIGTTLSDIGLLQGLVKKLKASGPSALADMDQATLLSDLKAAQRSIGVAVALMLDQTHGPQAVALLKKVLAP